MPKISVIIPVYNQEKFLQEALESLKGDFIDFEVIIVNDGSVASDAKEVINSICSEFKDFSIKIIHQKNKGVSNARNRAIEEACGEYILPLDADDKIKNSYMQKAIALLDENPNLGIVYCQVELFGDESGVWELGEASVENMLIRNRIFNSAFFRKSDWKKFGGYKESFTIGHEDWDFWLSFYEAKYDVYQIPEVLFFYRKHPHTRSENAMKNYSADRRFIFKYHKRLFYKNLVFCTKFCFVEKFRYCKRKLKLIKDKICSK